MKEWVCTVCDYVYEGGNTPEKCPRCGVPASRFEKQASEGMAWVYEYEIGVAQGSPEGIMMGLRANFGDEYFEVGVHLAMSGITHREGYPKVGMYWTEAAFEEAERAVKFVELLGGAVTSLAEKNLEMGVAAENGVTAGKFDLAKRARAFNLDTAYDTVHETAKDEARHGKTFEGSLNRYFD